MNSVGTPDYDVIVVGAGPAGSTCAAFCAQSGLRTLLLEKAEFPREKVCGDCLNPLCWPVLERLGVADRVLGLPHSRLEKVEFVGLWGSPLRFAMAPSPRGEIAVKRSLLDALLLTRAAELGVTIRTATSVTEVQRGWSVQTAGEIFTSRFLIAADGRNSTVARLLGLLPAAHRDRLGLQTHVAAPADFGEKVSMRFLRKGYCGVASVGGGELNLCLVGRAAHVAELKAWAGAKFGISPEQQWQTIAPLARAAVDPSHPSLLLIGDAARVVEPFTGEGIYYALATGELAAAHLVTGDLASYTAAQQALYRGRLWVNELSKFAVMNPFVATAVLGIARVRPELLRFLTSKVVGVALSPATGASAPLSS